MANTSIDIFSIFITLSSFYIANIIYRKTKFPLFHPVLLSIITIIAVLKILNISYEEYNSGGKFISILLAPSVVALAVPLYHQRKVIKEDFIPLLTAIFCGSTSGIISVLFVGKMLNVNEQIILSMLPKSVTTPIAMSISRNIYGIESLTAVVVICTGILGAAIGIQVLKFFGIKSKTAIGTAIGTAAHGIGTARANEEGEIEGAFSAIALGLAGIFTAIMTPIIAKLFF